MRLCEGYKKGKAQKEQDGGNVVSQKDGGDDARETWEAEGVQEGDSCRTLVQ